MTLLDQWLYKHSSRRPDLGKMSRGRPLALYASPHWFTDHSGGGRLTAGVEWGGSQCWGIPLVIPHSKLKTGVREKLHVQTDVQKTSTNLCRFKALVVSQLYQVKRVMYQG